MEEKKSGERMKRNVMIALICGVIIVAWFLMPQKTSFNLPIYPGAKLHEEKTRDLEKKLEMSFIKGCEARFYTTADDPNKVASFYETEMLKLGWELYNKQTFFGVTNALILKKGDQGAAIGMIKSLTGTETHIGIVIGPWERALQACALTLNPL